MRAWRWGVIVAGVAAVACAQSSTSPTPLPASPALAAQPLDAAVSAPQADAPLPVAATAPSSASQSLPAVASQPPPSAAPACVPGKGAASTLSDAELFAEIKACAKGFSLARGKALLDEAQRRVRAHPISKDDLVDKMGRPTHGEHITGIFASTGGKYSERAADGVKTATSVLMWFVYGDHGVVWQYWFAIESDRVVGAGKVDAPLE